jgi:hypothetical protein
MAIRGSATETNVSLTQISRPAMGPTQSGSFAGVKQSAREAEHSYPSTDEVKNENSYAATPRICLHVDSLHPCNRIHPVPRKVQFHLYGLIGTASHPDKQKSEIIGFFFENKLLWQSELRLLLFTVCTCV